MKNPFVKPKPNETRNSREVQGRPKAPRPYAEERKLIRAFAETSCDHWPQTNPHLFSDTCPFCLSRRLVSGGREETLMALKGAQWNASARVLKVLETNSELIRLLDEANEVASDLRTQLSEAESTVASLMLDPIVRVLQAKPIAVAVADIAEELGETQPRVRTRLKTLEDEGQVSSEKEGKRVVWRVADPMAEVAEMFGSEVAA